MALTDEDKDWMRALVRSEVTEKIDGVEQKIFDMETKLLTAFHQWASPADMRTRTHAAAIRALDAEMESLSDRVTKLEKPNA